MPKYVLSSKGTEVPGEGTNEPALFDSVVNVLKSRNSRCDTTPGDSQHFHTLYRIRPDQKVAGIY